MLSHDASLTTTLLAVFISAFCGGLLARKLKLPMIVGYIAAGILVGNITTPFLDTVFLERIGDTGVTLLLFALGVEFSFHRLRTILGSLVWAVTAQILLCIAIFLFILLGMGFAFVPALFFGVAFSLSSTAVVVKILSERGELESVPGVVATGWLVLQDLAVIPIMIILPALVHVQTADPVTAVSVVRVVLLGIVQSAAAVGIVFFLGIRGVPLVLQRVAKLANRELFLLTTVGLVFTAAVITYSFGLSAALGAFIAGLLVSETSQNHAIFSEIRPLRDLFAVVFFVTLGMVVPISVLLTAGWVIVALAVAVISVKSFLILGLTRFLGYHRKTAFLVAIGLTQVSEFGFIIAREGVRLGALSYERYVILVAVTFLTILISAPFLSRGHDLYYAALSVLGRFWPTIFPVKNHDRSETEFPMKNHIVICGYGRVGKYIGRALEMANVPFVVIDYDSATVAKLKQKGRTVVYGDPADHDVLDYAQVDFARALVIAIPDRHTQEMIIGHAKSLQRKIPIICRTHHEEDQARLKSLGVSSVVQPEFEASLSIIAKLFTLVGIPPEEATGKISRLKIEHGASPA